MRRFSAVMLGVVTLAAACCAVAAWTALPAGASEPAAGVWGTAQPVPGLAALGNGEASRIASVSCGSAGNCAAGGVYADSDDRGQAFVVDETGGSWGKAEEVPGLAALNVGGAAAVSSVSCASAGNCAAGGTYRDSAGNEQAFVVDESGGSWGKAEEVPGLAALTVSETSITSVSCASAGNCAAVGTYTDSSAHQQAFVADETGGTWGTAEEVPGLAVLDAGGSASISSVSCASTGNCAAGGTYNPAGSGQQAFVVDQTDGTWGAAQEVPGSAALNPYEAAGVLSVSCPSAGNCTAVGSVGAYLYSSPPPRYVLPQAFVVDETGGSWQNAQLLPGTATTDTSNSNAGTYFGSVSCGSAGNCVAVGDSDYEFPIIAEESGGSWGAAKAIPGMGGNAPPSVSCASAGDCAVVGDDGLGYFALDETGGSWGTAHEISGTAGAVSPGYDMSVSCPSAGNCAAGGTQQGSGETFQPLLVSEKPATSSVLALSAAKVTYGKEQAERVSVTVSAPSGATPSGTVTVKAGTTVVCGNLELSAGRVSCTVAATKLPAGTWHLAASYSGSGSLAGSTSAARTLTVAKAASKITLSLSAATVTYGHEQSERLTVKVTGQYAGTPAGKVTVKSGTTTVCTITLAAAKGSCTLAARKLPVGTRTLTAVYSGSGDFTGAASARKTLRVVT